MAAGSTYTPIATTTLGSSAASYTFNSIPTTYTDLVLIINGSASTGTNMELQVGNGSVDTGSNYSDTWLAGSGTSALSGRDAPNYPSVILSNYYNFQGMTIINFMNYSNTTTYKTFLSRAGAADWATAAYVGLWRSTAAINTIKIASGGATTWNAGTSFTIYGISAA
jgi:hypothetical protein